MTRRHRLLTEVHWVVLGDIVHAPSEDARRTSLYDFDDGSFAIVKSIADLKARFPEHVHFVLGNHDYGHIGGPRTSKFHGDEVKALEDKLTPEERAFMRGLFADALLLVAAPCGVLLTHGSPDTTLGSLDQFDDVELATQSHALRSLLGAYGQPRATTAAMLREEAVCAARSLGSVRTRRRSTRWVRDPAALGVK